MRISGNDPSSLILSQTKWIQKLKMIVQKFQNKLKPKAIVLYTKKTKQFLSILIRKIFILSKRYESTEVYRRTWLHVPSGTHWSTSSDTDQDVEI